MRPHGWFTALSAFQMIFFQFPPSGRFMIAIFFFFRTPNPSPLLPQRGAIFLFPSFLTVSAGAREAVALGNKKLKRKQGREKCGCLELEGGGGRGEVVGRRTPPPSPDPGGHNNIVCRSGKVQSNVMICVCVTFSFFLFLIISCPFPSPSSSSLCLLPPPLPLPPPPLEIWGCVSYWSVVV